MNEKVHAHDVNIHLGGFTPHHAVMDMSLTFDPPYVLNTDVSPPVLLHH